MQSALFSTFLFRKEIYWEKLIYTNMYIFKLYHGVSFDIGIHLFNHSHTLFHKHFILSSNVLPLYLFILSDRACNIILHHWQIVKYKINLVRRIGITFPPSPGPSRTISGASRGAQVVERLPSKCEDLSSNTSIATRKSISISRKKCLLFLLTYHFPATCELLLKQG
jgi:hypothetical protein